MPSYKVLKSVVTSMAESFTSCMNYYDNDYVMGHIVLAAWHTGDTTIIIDVLSGAMKPSKLLTKPVRLSLERYTKWFPELVKSSGSSMSFITSAVLTIGVIPSVRRPTYLGSDLQESPYRCSMSIIDDRGKEYLHEISSWWYPEQPPVPDSMLSHLSQRLIQWWKRDT